MLSVKRSELIAQLVEHRTFNPRAESSNLSGLTFWTRSAIGRATAFGAVGSTFESWRVRNNKVTLCPAQPFLFTKEAKMRTTPDLRKPTFLSIDLDYWCNETTSRKAMRFMRKVLELPVPIHVVASHEDVRFAANRAGREHGARVLINVDQHIDNTPLCQLSPDEANWVNHIVWKKEGTYVWLAPIDPMNKEQIGWCGQTSLDMEDPKGWGAIRMDRGTLGLPGKRIVGVGVSVSLTYITARSLGRVPELLIDHWKRRSDVTMKRRAKNELQMLLADPGYVGYTHNYA